MERNYVEHPYDDFMADFVKVTNSDSICLSKEQLQQMGDPFELCDEKFFKDHQESAMYLIVASSSFTCAIRTTEC